MSSLIKFRDFYLNFRFIPALTLTTILVAALLAINFVNNKRKLRKFNIPSRDGER